MHLRALLLVLIGTIHLFQMGESSSSNFYGFNGIFMAVDGSLTPTSFSTTTYQMVLATFTPPTPDI